MQRNIDVFSVALVGRQCPCTQPGQIIFEAICRLLQHRLHKDYSTSPYDLQLATSAE
jgi:hypothetical protein